jgi:hypothetical protein
VKQKAFCGEGDRHCSVCLAIAVISLLRDGEDNLLKKTCKYTFFFCLNCSRGSNCLYGGWTKIYLISCSLCGYPQHNFGPHKALRHTWHFEHRRSRHAPCWTRNIAVSWNCGQAGAYCGVCPVFWC